MTVDLQNTVNYDNKEDLSCVNIDFKQSFFLLVRRALRERKPREKNKAAVMLGDGDLLVENFGNNAQEVPRSCFVGVAWNFFQS